MKLRLIHTPPADSTAQPTTMKPLPTRLPLLLLFLTGVQAGITSRDHGGGFLDCCRDIKLEDGKFFGLKEEGEDQKYLSAKCWADVRLRLDGCIGNRNGNLVWEEG